MASVITCLEVLLGVLCVQRIIVAEEGIKEEVDKVIEDEITEKLSSDLLQSIERKFQVDLERSVDMVLVKIRLLLQNGTTHIQDRLQELQVQLGAVRSATGKKVDDCLNDHHNETTALAEKALHQMVVCGYALIGHDPAQAISAVVAMKDMIRTRLQPLQQQRREVYSLLKVCGHDHDSLRKVIKCVIAKSPLIKSTMMDVTGKLITGVVDLTKLMAHGAMHEACLIEVIKSVEDEAFTLVSKVRNCAFGNETMDNEVKKYMEDNNATVLDVQAKVKDGEMINGSKAEVVEMKELLRRMLSHNDTIDLDKKFRKKLKKFQKDLKYVDDNMISNDAHKNDE